MPEEPIRHEIEIEKLHFDSLNPRLPENMNRSSEDEVLTWMLRKGDIIELMASIGATGYSSAEAVLAIPHGTKEGHYEVVEGNRRLAAVKLLAHPGLASVRKNSVEEISNAAAHQIDAMPVLAYNERTDILAYLGYRHITGIKAWGPKEKAKYLKQLFDHYAKTDMKEEDIFQTVSQVVATKPYYAKKKFTTLALVKLANETAYWGLEGLTADDVKFSVLETALSYEQIVKYLGMTEATDWHLKSLNPDRLKDLYTWLFQRDPEGNTRVRESRELPTLAKIVDKKEALLAFKNGYALSHAAELTDEADDAFRKFLISSYQKLEMAQGQLKRIQSPAEADLETLREIWAIAKDMGSALKDRLTTTNEDTPF